MNKAKIYCLELKITFDSVLSASQILGISDKSIDMCINGKQKTAGGYHFICVDNLFEKNLEKRLSNVENMLKGVLRENKIQKYNYKTISEKVSDLENFPKPDNVLLEENKKLKLKVKELERELFMYRL